MEGGRQPNKFVVLEMCVMKSQVAKRSIVVAGHKTSVSLEDAFWNGLKEIAGRRDITLSDLVAAIDSQRHHGNLSSAIRLFVLEFYRHQGEQQAEQAKHSKTG
jgi:predicted DNA-binding ribbon-helix-helix protein